MSTRVYTQADVAELFQDAQSVHREATRQILAARYPTVASPDHVGDVWAALVMESPGDVIEYWAALAGGPEAVEKRTATSTAPSIRCTANSR